MEQIAIRPIGTDDEIRAAAGIMARSEVWRRLGRTFANTYAGVSHPAFEKLVAIEDQQVVGICMMAIALPLIRGYIAGLAVDDGWRRRGIGRKLLETAEVRIFRESPNVFLCVSSFNTDGQRFYETMGYQRVGELKDYQIRGASEYLMCKSTGPWCEFNPADD